MAKEKIANRQLWIIIFIIRMTIVVSLMPVLTSGDGLQDAWLSTLVVLAVSVIIVLVVALLDSKFIDKTIIHYAQYLLGSYLGKVIIILLLWNFLQFAVLELRLYSEMIITAFLPATPLFFIINGMIILAAVAAYMGLETIARCADFIFFILLIMLMLIILIPIFDFDFANLQPVLVRGWKPVLSSVVTPIALMNQIWVITVLGVNLTKPKKIIKTTTSAVASAIGILLVVVVITIAVLGPHQGSRSVFPLLTLMRSVEVGKIVQRTEIFVIFSWGMGLFIAVATYFYSFVKGVAQLFKLKDYRSLIWPTAVLVSLLTIYGFEGVFELNTFLCSGVYGQYGIITILLPLILLWASYGLKSITKKGELKNEKD